MDAEIGIRNLADQSRYNVLPNVVKRLYVNEVSRPFDQLPEHERLALLVSNNVRAQASQTDCDSSHGLRPSSILQYIIHFCK